MRVAVSVLTITLLGAGCAGVTFQFGGAPVAIPRADPVGRCVQANRIVLRPAYAEFESRRGIGNNTVLVTSHRGRGVIFYRGRTRLTAEQALGLLGDVQLEATYVGLYKKQLESGTRRLHVANWSIGIGSLLAVIGGIAMTAVMLKPRDLGDPTPKTAFWTTVGITSVGGIVAMVGMFMKPSAAKDANMGEAFQTVFLATDLRPALQKALRRYNRTVDARCGLRPAPTTPTTPAPRPLPRPLPQPSDSIPPPR